MEYKFLVTDDLVQNCQKGKYRLGDANKENVHWELALPSDIFPP